jgi:drug/metabolite transporter (DMT)-like permease
VIEIVLLLLIVAAGTGGELCVARAMKQVGEVVHFHPSALLDAITAALAVPWLWAGLGLLIVDVLALLAMLSLEKVSFVIPMTALNYVVGALGGKFFLGERVGPARWAGISLVCMGVALVFLGGR